VIECQPQKNGGRDQLTEKENIGSQLIYRSDIKS